MSEPEQWTIGTTETIGGDRVATVGLVARCFTSKGRLDVSWRPGAPPYVIADALESLAYQLKRATQPRNENAKEEARDV